jgi:hypothetical protein
MSIVSQENWIALDLEYVVNLDSKRPGKLAADMKRGR